MPAMFFPLRPIDGYLPLEDYGLIGDGITAALVGRDGAVSWLCVPRFDSPPLFCRILDTTRGWRSRLGSSRSHAFSLPVAWIRIGRLCARCCGRLACCPRLA
jgi:hypothetical protein